MALRINHATAAAAFVLWVVLAASSSAQAALILHYTIDSTTVVGGTIEDVSPTQENDAARSGGGNFVLTADRNGTANEAVIVGNSIAVDNTNGITSGGSGEFTFATWYKGIDSGYLFDQESTRLVLSVNLNTQSDGNDGGAAAGLGLFWNGTWYNSGFTTGLNDNDWHHVAFVLDNDGLNSFFSIYIDGVAIDVDPATGGVQTTRSITGIANLIQQGTNFRQRIASGFDGAAAATLSGSYDDIRIYDAALSGSEVAALVAEIPSPAALPAGLALMGLAAVRRRRLNA